MLFVSLDPQRYLTSLVPRPFELRRRRGLVHIVCACTGGLQKKLGDLDIHITVRDLGQVTMEMRPVAMEKPAHM